MFPSSSESKRIDWNCGWVIQTSCKEGASSERHEEGWGDDLVRGNRKSEENRNVGVRKVCVLLRDYTGAVTQNTAFRVITDLKT
jgi:hypothetical protein